MATYTDLHNRVKENITVDYNNRITPQEVHLLNQNNIYWGTLSGQVSAENISIKGGTLEGVTLKNTNLIGGINFPDLAGINFAEIAANVKSLSTGLRDLISASIEKHEEFVAKDSSHDTSINALNAAVEKLDREKIDSDDVFEEISVISVAFDRKIQDLSDNLSIEINNLSTKTFETIDQLSVKTFETIDQLSDEVSAISTFLSNEVENLGLRLNGEIANRVMADTLIEKNLSSAVEESKERDSKLGERIDKCEENHDADIKQLSNQIFAKIEHDKHYAFNTTRLTDVYPFDCKDFTINKYNPTLKSGTVEYVDNDGNTFIIGEIRYNEGETIFKTYKDIDNDEIASILRLNFEYRFTPDSNTISSKKSFYQLEYSSANNRITLLPVHPEYYPVTYRLDQIGKIYNAEINAENYIVSGKIFIDTNDTSLEIFNQFKDKPFNTTNLSVLKSVDECEQIEYHGNNVFKFLKNVTTVNYIPVHDVNGEEFARIFEPKNPNLENEINITLTYLSPEEQTISLNNNNNYHAIIQQNELCNLILSADIIDNTAKFDVVYVSELYKYSFNSIDDNGEVTTGYIIPEYYNKTLSDATSEGKNFDVVSVDFTNVMQIESFKRVFKLERVSETDDIWFGEDNDDNGNVINIKFNGNSEIRCQIIKNIDNTNKPTLAYKFDVNYNEPEIYNTENCYNHIYTSDFISLAEYTETVKYTNDANIYYPVNTQSSPKTDSPDTLQLKINDADNDIVKICVPDRSTNDISREFAIVINPQYSQNKLIELQLTNKSGEKVDYISNRREQMFKVPTNMWTYLQVNEINHNKFFIKDLDANENTHDVRTLSASIEKLSTALSGEIDSLSTKLSTELSNEISARLSSFEYLSSQISSNDEDIAEIFRRIKGGVNYKGTVVCEIKSTDSVGENIKNITSISALFFREGTTPESIYTNENEVLSNGFMYIVKAVDSTSKKKFIIEEKDIEVGDQIIINCKDADGKAIKDLTINDVDIIDNEDYDTVHQPEFNELSNNLSAEIDSLSTALSTEISALSINLSTEISSLSDNISNDVSCLSVKHLFETEYLSNKISSKIFIDDKINNDVNGHSDLSIIKISKEEYDNLNASDQTVLCANTLYIVESDYFDAYGQVISNLVMTDNTNPSEATNKDYVDAIDLRLDTKINTLSDDLSAEISSLGTSLSTEISALSINLSTDLSNISASIALSASNIRGDITTISDDLLSINTRYVNTFTAPDNNHISSDNLILTESEHAENDTDPQHKQYKMMFERGTIVLKPLN